MRGKPLKIRYSNIRYRPEAIAARKGESPKVWNYHKRYGESPKT
jgi:hypothetical protein